MLDSRVSDYETSRRDIPSFIEPRPPLISNPFMRPRPQKGTNLLELFEEDSECEEPELVQVYLRLKPCNNPSNLYEVRSDRYLITSLDTATAGHGRRTQHNVSKMYTFSQIFGPETNQKEIFENVVKDNLKKLPEGNSFTLLTYGASGSGKTFTLMGTVASPGLVPRSLEYVFKMVDAAQVPVFKPSESGADKLSYIQQEYELQWMKRLQISAPLKDKYRRMSVQLGNDLAASNLDLSNRSRHYVWVSFIEIYNEGIYDLLAPGERRNAQKLAIREDTSGNVYVKGATQAFVRSGEEAYDIMVAGKHNLQVAATGVHARSSRSHCIFTITMLTEGESGVSASHVRLCDLAGCERAARTRNTGARMCESRAINSSLHVLERCLRALRRRRAVQRRELVPYRESKLTRLLGSGLSGARGEAVGMVVTLNPSPDYANETRHVLQLAAVAKDIQINNTLSEYPSSLEITQDTTIELSAEVMKLRADNERLHFELVQAQARNKELLSCMERRQAAGADAVRELVDEARDITRHYYEEQLRALRDQMDEMTQEYESKLRAAEVPKSDTPSRSMEAKINQLVTDIAILEEKLTAEKLARGRVEEEVQHLRACIEERDEKADEVASAENVTLTDSESEEDPCNESLEPSFRKEDINKSRLLRQSAIQAEQSYSDTSVLDKTNDTLKDYSHGYESSEDVTGNASDSSARESVDNMESNVCTVKKANISKKYFVEETLTKASALNVHNKLGRKTYNVTDSGTTFNNDQLKTEEHCKSLQNKIADENNDFPKIDHKMAIDKQPNSFVNKIISSIKKSTDSNNSLAQFERLELAAEKCDDKVSITEVFTDINILKEKRNFFDNGTKTPATKERKIYFANLNIEEPKTILGELKHTDDYRSPSIVKEEITHDFTPSMIKKLLGESKRQGGNMVHKAKISSKTHDSIDLFEFDSPQVLPKIGEVETLRKSVANISISDKIENNDDLVTCDMKPIGDKIVVKTFSSENATHKDERKSVHIKNTEIQIINNETNAQYIIKQLSPSKKEMTSKQIDVEAIKGEHTTFKITDEVRERESLPKRSYFEDNIQIEITAQKSEDIAGDISKGFFDHGIEEKNPALCEDLTKQNNDDSQSEIYNINVDNTIEQFDNIYKEVTAPNDTDFELLLSQEIRESSIEDNNKSNNNEETDDLKYNLRHRKTEKPKPDTKKEIKDKPKRMNLRLRRRKNLSEDDDSEKEVKFKDIVNLQSEFSDVTMDVPATSKMVKDIPSPEKVDDENLPPILGIQSCPSKSVSRSRRKLFTPRAEPLDESGRAGDSAERVCVPRPSYQRPRARRKL